MQHVSATYIMAIAAAVFVLAITVWLYTHADDANAHAAPLSPLAQANKLVLAVESKRGLQSTPLNAENQIAFGTLMFRFLPNRDKLVVAVLVAHDPTWNRINDQFTATYRRSRAALSDPQIGGLFDTAGSAWLFEETTGRTYLYREFPLDTLPAAINKSIGAIAEIVPAWEFRWLTAVAEISQGKRPAPSQRVTMDNDPYAGEL